MLTKSDGKRKGGADGGCIAKRNWKPMDARKFNYDVKCTPTRPYNRTCEPIPNVTLDLAQILTPACQFFFFSHPYEDELSGVKIRHPMTNIT